MEDITIKSKIRIEKSFASRMKEKAAEAATLEGNAIEMKNRIGIITDDSSSMNGHLWNNAKQGIEIFLRNCTPQDSSIALYFLNHTPVNLTTSYHTILLFLNTFEPTGSTPLGRSMRDMLENEAMTRAIIFSDGEPNSAQECFDVASQYKEIEIPIDTIFISPIRTERESSAEATLRRISEITGGIFMSFSDMEKMKTTFGYLAPAKRLMLNDANIRRSLGSLGEEK